MTDGARSGRERLTPPEAVASFDEGLQRYREGDAVAAHALFERAHRRAPFDARLMSWYGLTLVMVERNSNLGMLFCDQSLRMAGPDAELLLNQARAHLALGQRDRAVRSVIRGLATAPLDPALRAAQTSMGWRRKPVLPFLHRNNPINRWLGKLRHKWSRRMNPVPEVSPMMLGLLPPASPDEAPPRSE
jgi:tetratricopeptide (TPR) repeat protein